MTKTFRFLQLITLVLIIFSPEIKSAKKGNKKPNLVTTTIKAKPVAKPKAEDINKKNVVEKDNEKKIFSLLCRELPDSFDNDTQKIVSKFETKIIIDDIHSVLSSIIIKLNRNSFFSEEYSKKECLDFFNKIEDIVSEPSVLDAMSATIKEMVFVPLCQIRTILEYNNKLRKPELAQHISDKMEEIVTYIDEEVKRRNILGSATFTKAIKSFKNIDFENFDAGIKKLSVPEYCFEMLRTHTKHIYAGAIGTATVITGLIAIKLLGGFGGKGAVDKMQENAAGMTNNFSTLANMWAGTASLDLELEELKTIQNISDDKEFDNHYKSFIPRFYEKIKSIDSGICVYHWLLNLLEEAKNKSSVWNNTQTRKDCLNKIISHLETSHMMKIRDTIRNNQLPTIINSGPLGKEAGDEMIKAFKNMSEMFNKETGKALCRAFSKMSDACLKISNIYMGGWKIGIKEIPPQELAAFDQARSELIDQLKEIINTGTMNNKTTTFINELLQLLEQSLTKNNADNYYQIFNKLKDLVNNKEDIFEEIKGIIEGFDVHPIATIIRTEPPPAAPAPAAPAAPAPAGAGETAAPEGATAAGAARWFFQTGGWLRPTWSSGRFTLGY